MDGTSRVALEQHYSRNKTLKERQLSSIEAEHK
jgi:hypothetical protein